MIELLPILFVFGMALFFWKYTLVVFSAILTLTGWLFILFWWISGFRFEDPNFYGQTPVAVLSILALANYAFLIFFVKSEGGAFDLPFRSRRTGRSQRRKLHSSTGSAGAKAERESFDDRTSTTPVEEEEPPEEHWEEGTCPHCRGTGKCQDDFHSGTPLLNPFGGIDDQGVDRPSALDNMFGRCPSCGDSNTEWRPPCPHCDGKGMFYRKVFGFKFKA